ncbi:3-oxoacyl-[acyl-carrier protein] reductase [Enterococcus sp. DIV2402]|uniref:3-oxoacyl-[acyl-carrier protein] reductase n=1 Tax=Candidatus Enterococcus lowellii TaxID=2230877 RepID=A0ABZ2SQN3_9ENTE|nr:SDR family oxidoreductase [Enterococcus sp. DIV2402]MBO0463386.1 SDR family oxidoreductase [Enterococcus sp. DIV2402]
MELYLKNKTVLVTGSTKGIGKAIAIEFAREGASVIINGRQTEAVSEVVHELKQQFPETNPQAAPFDLSKDTQREQLFVAFPEVDILINNMGIFQPIDYFEITDEVWKTYFTTNVLAGNALAKFYLPKMLANDFGRILFIASEEALMPSGEMAQYSMTKTMNLSLAKSLSRLTKQTNVTVNTILPGSTLTEGVHDMLVTMYQGSGLDEADWEADFMKNHRPLSQIQRLIRPEEIGRFVVFVASPASRSFSGAALRLDGGMIPTIF